jgi:hypothetical protein
MSWDEKTDAAVTFAPGLDFVEEVRGVSESTDEHDTLRVISIRYFNIDGY